MIIDYTKIANKNQAQQVLDKIMVRQYDKHYSYGTDWVNEFTIISEKEYSEEQITELIEKENHTVNGQVEYSKKRLTFKDGTVLNKYIVRSIFY